MMEFSAAFYLKSLSESNQQEQLGREVGQLFDYNCQSTENILASTLEMLIPGISASDVEAFRHISPAELAQALSSLAQRDS